MMLPLPWACITRDSCFMLRSVPSTLLDRRHRISSVMRHAVQKGGKCSVSSHASRSLCVLSR